MRIVLDDLGVNFKFLLCFHVVDGLMKYDSDKMKEIMLFDFFFGKNGHDGQMWG